jgi:predicted GNAT family N-acyltransferase
VFDGFTFKVASAPEAERAIALRREVFLETFGRMPEDDLDATAHHLVAVNAAGEVVAAFRLLGPEHRPFDVEAMMDFGTVVPSTRTPALIGRLAARKDHRGIGQTMFLQMGLMKLGYEFAAKHGITDYVLYTYPHLTSFYRAMFFEPIGEPIDHPAWGDLRLMRLDVVGLPPRLAGSRSSLARLLLARDLSNFIV